MPTGGIDVGIGSLLSGVLGTTVGTGLADAGVGALAGGALGGAESALSGGNFGQGILHGAEGGALTGGGIGLGGELLGPELGSTIGSGLGGAAGGALGGVATGSNPAIGAAEGAVAGGLMGSSAPGSGGGSIGGAAPGAAAQAAPIGGVTSSDLAPFDQVAASANPTSLALDGTLSPDAASPSGDSGLNNIAASGNNLGVANPAAGGAGGVPSSITNPSAGIGNIDSSQFATLNANPAAGGAGGPAAPAQTSGQAFLKNPGAGTFGNMLMANPGAAVSGLGLAADAIKGNQPVKGERQLNQAAAADTANGNQLQSYIQSGQLPPGAQASIASAANAQKASIRNRYAQEGSSGSSSEQQDLAAVDAWSQGQGSQLAMQLLQQGISESNLGAQLYGDISKTALQQDQSLGSAFGSFASSLAGGGGSSPKGTITFGNG